MSSKTIDENVVQMKFDNAQFESNVKTTMSTLDKLKSALNFKGSETALDGLDSAAAKLNKGGLLSIGNSLDTVHAKFSALEVVGMTALSNITTSAMNTGKKIVDALTINGQRDGFAEYEKIIDATKIIQASSPDYSLEQINGYLEELNTYADKTIYSFSDMTDNIGKFTNAGVDLPDAVAAIQGIANAAALSGSNASQASHAMYNFAQALSAGYVKLIDWKSIENAQMATVEFKEELLNTATELGLLKDAGDGTYDILNIVNKQAPTWTSSTAMFNDSLAQQWMTTEVLTKTLAKYTDETTDIGKKATKAATQITTFSKLIDTVKESIGSGWSRSFQLIFGGLEEATELWTNLNDNVIEPFISKMSETRNKALEIWRESPDGFKTVKHGVVELYNWVSKLGSIISKNYNEVFQGSKTLDEILISISKKFDKFATSLNSHTIIIENLGKLIRGIFDILATGKNIIGGVFSIAKHLIESIYSTLGGKGGLIGLVGDLGEGMSDFANMLTKADIDKFVASVNKKIDEVIPKLKPVLEFVVNAIEGVIGVIITLGNTIYDFVTGDKKSLNELVDGLEETPEDSGFVKWVKKFVKDLADGFSDIENTTNPFVKFLKSAWEEIQGVFDTISTKITPIGEKIKGFGKDISDALSSFGDNKSSFDLKKVSLIALGLAAVIKIWDSFDDTKTKFNILVNPIGAMTDLINGIGEAFEAKKVSEYLNIAKTFGQVVLMIAGSLFLVSLIDTGRATAAVAQIGVIFGMMAGILITFEKMSKKAQTASSNVSIALSVITNPKKGITGIIQQFVSGLKISLPDFKMIYEMNARAAMLKAMALAVLAIAGALLIMDHVNLKKAVGSAALLTAMVGALSFMAYQLAGAKMKSNLANDISTATQAFGSLAVMIAGLYVIAKTLQTMDGLDHAVKNAFILGGFIVALGIMSRVMAGSKGKLFDGGKEYESRALEAMGSILVLCTGLYLIARALKKMDDLDHAVGNAIILGALTAELGVIAYKLAQISENVDADNLAATAKLMKSLATTMLTVAGVLLVLDHINSNGHPVADLIEFALLCGALDLTVLGLAKISEHVDPDKMEAVKNTLVSMSASMLIMAVSLKVLSTIDFKSMMVALAGMGGALAEMSGALILIDKFTKYEPSGMEQLIKMATAMLLVSVSLKILGSMEWYQIGRGLAAMGGALAEMSLAMGAIAFINSKFGAVNGAGSIVALSASMILLAGAMKVLGSLDSDEIKHALIALGGALAELVVAMAILGALSPLISGVGASVALFGAGIAAVGGGIAALAIGLKILGTISQETAQNIVAVIQTFVNGLAEMIPEMAEAFVLSIVSLGNTITEHLPELVAALSQIVGALLDTLMEVIPKIAEFAIQLIVTLATTLAEHVGEIIDAGANLVTNFITGVADAAEKYLPSIYDAFKRIFTTIFNGIVGVFEEVFATIGEAIGKILGSIVDGFLQGMADGLKSFGTGLSEFMEAAAPFFKALGSIDPSVIESAKVVAEVCLIFAAAELVQGVSNFVSAFTGDSSLATFGNELAEFGKSLNEFGNNTKDVNAQHITRVAKAAKALVEFATAIPNEGGLVAKITGDNSLSKFASELTEFGTGLQKFDDSIKAIEDTSRIEMAANAGKILIDFTEKIPNEGGLVAKITGDNSLSKFAEELVPFGTNLDLFVQKISGLTENDISSTKIAADMGLCLAEFANDIPNEGGLLADITGDNSLSAFAKEMDLFATSLMTFRSTIAGISEEDIKAASISTDIGRVLIAFAEDASKAKGLTKLVKDKTLDGFSTVLNPFADGIRSFVDKVTGISEAESDITNAMSLLTLFNDVSIQNAGKNSKNLTVFGAGIKDLGEAISKFLKYLTDGGISEIETYTKNFLQAFVAVANDKKVDFKRVGEELFKEFLRGGRDVKTSEFCNEFINNVVDTLRSNSNAKKFYNAGKNLVEGFANGMKENSDVAVKAAEKVADSTIKAAQKKLDEHSPSRVFYQIGDYAVRGLVNALTDGSALAYNASETMAGSAVDALKSSVSRISDYVQNGLGDEGLTLTPVLDLSNVSDGIRSINSMFAHEQAMSITSNGFNGNAVNGTTLNQILAALQEFNGFNVVMDTGATVGALAPTMNSALGQISYRESRR